MEKGCICYFLFEHSQRQRSNSSRSRLFHSPLQGSNPSRSGLFLYKLDSDDINAHIPLLKDRCRQPLRQPIFRFVPGKYPKGMGCGMVERKLYFLGGYFPHEINDPEVAPLKYSEEMYILDPTRIDGGSTEEFIEKELIQVRVSKYINKSNPLVVTVEGKLYVLPRNFGAEHGIRPSIQSYDPYQDKWENYDIFELLKEDSEFCYRPSATWGHEVFAHCVQGNEIIVVLYVGAYSFNVNSGILNLLGEHTHTPNAIPFRGLAAVVDGCFFGLQCNDLVGYTSSPFGIFSSKSSSPEPSLPDVLVHECPHNFYKGLGLVIQLADVQETKLLVARSGALAALHARTIQNDIYLAFDFLTIVKDDKGSPCCSRSHTIGYHVDEDEAEYDSHIVACFPYDLQIVEFVDEVV